MLFEEYKTLWQYAQSMAEPTVHDIGHVHRVVQMAAHIAKESAAEIGVLVPAAILHDIARAEQSRDKLVNHAHKGAEMAEIFLLQNGFDAKKAGRVFACIKTHSYKNQEPPKTLEAEILFDADKLDICGAVGVARVLQFGERIGEPLYSTTPAGTPLLHGEHLSPSFFREYYKKLVHIEDKLFTQQAKEIAQKRAAAMQSFVQSLEQELEFFV